MMLLEILSQGSGLSIQDQGRYGWRRYGVPSGGAMDVSAMQEANRLLGNSLNVPVLEIAQQGVRLRVLRDTWLSLAGADLSSQFPSGSARRFAAGEVLEMDKKSEKLYTYLALPGGVQSDAWLGSSSSDMRNGMGVVIEKGSKLNSTKLHPDFSAQGVARRLSSKATHSSADNHFELHKGPQFDLFDESARRMFIDGEWCVSTQSDRTGYRLQGPELSVPKMIPSEPVLPGSFQVPGDGQPIVTMHDGPTVGGYAKLAILKAKDIARFAQNPPGRKLTFSWID